MSCLFAQHGVLTLSSNNHLGLGGFNSKSSRRDHDHGRSFLTVTLAYPKYSANRTHSPSPLKASRSSTPTPI